MSLELSDEQIEAARSVLAGDAGEALRTVMFEVSLGRAPSDPRGLDAAVNLGWLSADGTLTPIGAIAKDPMREHEFWRHRGRGMPAEDELPWMRPARFAGLDVLEVGCGSACNLFTILRRGAAGRVAGVDPVRSYLQFARVFADVERLPMPELSVGTASNLPFESASFDVVFCVSALQYADPAESAREMARVLKPGGRLLSIHNTLGPFAVETVVRFARERRLGTLLYDLTAVANSLSAMVSGQRRFGSDRGMSTARPLYPPVRFWRRMFADAGLTLERTDRIRSGETGFVALRR